jgi:hypothetical protein
MNTGYYLAGQREPFSAVGHWARANRDIPMNSLFPELNAITAEILTPMVRRSLRRTAVEIIEWHNETLRQTTMRQPHRRFYNC